MPELKLLHADHAPAVLAFELANRAYFAASVSDRGDDYFDRFTDRYHALLAEQEAGICAFYVLIDGDGQVLGRFNLYDIADHRTDIAGEGADIVGRRADIVERRADLGYRVAEHAAGRGVATAAVLELCESAETRHGLHTLRAATAHRNVASQKVLTKAGFIAVGPADPAELGGQPGTWYQRSLR
ncbi:GNAT family N-acetyltransferase [Actinoplanes derwentensis]|uniref:Ribosomal-protein-alanine N-acetyltransferase n=1 Tax=Actinoplanes derwentensis TaxID=113562 RepID=A0A1H1ZHU6_9ACTN|nr:GNAT family N-acetyltransferase [Actinoplanes derwentensis]GID82450.1 alanine acetyltransferase [Actinoplanes derwentensis]SDT33264.1 ribosomal-protein-alanine N-acetyltransferase [Actinoplanes derwentensis]